MAAAKTSVKNVNGYTTSMGNRGAAVKNVSWDNGTYPAGGLTLSNTGFGLRGFDAGFSGVSVGSNFVALVQIPAIGGKTAKLRLIVLATGVEVATNAPLTADSVAVFMVGG